MNYFMKQLDNGYWGVFSDKYKNQPDSDPIEYNILRFMFVNETEAQQCLADLITGVKEL
jgi:hypothetical protein